MRPQPARTHLGALAACLLFAGGPVLAGVVYEIETKDHDASPPRTETSTASVEGKNLAMEIQPGKSGAGKGKMIFRGDRGENGEVIVVDHDDKSYMVIDDAAVEAIAGQLGSVMSQVDKMLEGLPAEQRAEIEKVMKESGRGIPGAGAGARRPQSEIRKTGETATKNGYPCVKYEVWRDGRKLRELWVTDWSKIEGGAEARDAFGAMAGFFRGMMDKLPEMPGGAGDFDSFAENFREGFPVVTRELDETGELESETSLRSSQRRTLDPAEFEPPAGYKRRSMFPQ